MPHFIEGYELTDSWAIDLHKWLSILYNSGLVESQVGGRVIKPGSGMLLFFPSQKLHLNRKNIALP